MGCHIVQTHSVYSAGQGAISSEHVFAAPLRHKSTVPYMQYQAVLRSLQWTHSSNAELKMKPFQRSLIVPSHRSGKRIDFSCTLRFWDISLVSVCSMSRCLEQTQASYMKGRHLVKQTTELHIITSILSIKGTRFIEASTIAGILPCHS